MSNVKGVATQDLMLITLICLQAKIALLDLSARCNTRLTEVVFVVFSPFQPK